MNSPQCGGKKAYSTWAQAESEAKMLRRAKSAKAQPYRCLVCAGVHVGNQLGGRNLAGRIRRQKLQKIREREAWT